MSAPARSLPWPDGRLLCGVAASAAEFGSWREALAGLLDVRMQFVAWSRELDPGQALAGPGIPMISWEPWAPPPAWVPAADQGEPQPAYAGHAIAAGAHDPYIDRWASAVAEHPGPVLLRPMHEFNGHWYPWSHDPQAFVAAWRHLRARFDAAGARNAVWIWSLQPGGGEGPRRWRRRLAPYWPGDEHVDVVGMSMVRFLTGVNTVADYLIYLKRAHRQFGRPTMVTEANVAHALRDPWLLELSRGLAGAVGHNGGFVWSQLPSREQARNPAAGEMSWDAREDPRALAQLRAIAAIRVVRQGA